jgi:hypothetical protein
MGLKGRSPDKSSTANGDTHGIHGGSPVSGEYRQLSERSQRIPLPYPTQITLHFKDLDIRETLSKSCLCLNDPARSSRGQPLLLGSHKPAPMIAIQVISLSERSPWEEDDMPVCMPPFFPSTWGFSSPIYLVQSRNSLRNRAMYGHISAFPPHFLYRVLLDRHLEFFNGSLCLIGPSRFTCPRICPETSPHCRGSIEGSRGRPQPWLSVCSRNNS